MQKLCQKPFVDQGQLMDPIDGKTAEEGFIYGENAFIILCQDLCGQSLVIQCTHMDIRQTVVGDFCAANGFHQRLLEVSANGHDFTGGFHLGAELSCRIHEFVKGPFRKFNDNIVQRRLKAGLCFAGDFVFDFVHPVANGDFGSNTGDRIAGRLAGEGGGTGNPGVYLDNSVLKALGI